MKGLNLAPPGGSGSSMLTGAFLQRVQQTSALSAIVPDIQPGEMPITLTLAQLAPNPDNPRKTRNPRYDEIKDSIRNSGLDTVPRVTKDPSSSDDRYIFSNGGNTRYAILTELYEETRDERFFHILCVFRPWPGRLKCLIGHLKENDMRGDLTFIDRAIGIQRARELYSEESRCGHLSLRELSDRLKEDGYSLDASEIQRMVYALEWLYPTFPHLFNAGMGRPQVRNLIRLHRALSDAVSKNASLSLDSHAIFQATAAQYDAPDIWDFTVFQDALTSALSSASTFSADWWRLVLHGSAKPGAVPVSLPVVSEPAQSETVITPLPPAENPPPISADTAPGTEIRTAGLTLGELAAPHQDAGDPENKGNPPDLVPQETPAGSDPRSRAEYREQQLALSITETLPPEPPLEPDTSCVALDTRSVTRLRTQLLRQAYALAELAGVAGQVLSDDQPDGCGFVITQPDAEDASGILTFLTGLVTHSGCLVLPLNWLAGDNHQAPEHDSAFALAAALLSGINTLGALIREQGTDTITEENFE
ncbi:ParB family protein [Klebsiella quasivariicola]|uniref:ParB family protein n=1 Tax=Klebsiella quasivariicola TaxID=2026240 RepID=UPI0024785159|nr:ParB family protein [Klebsiella quasivariicola]